MLTPVRLSDGELLQTAAPERQQDRNPEEEDRQPGGRLMRCHGDLHPLFVIFTIATLGLKLQSVSIVFDTL